MMKDYLTPFAKNVFNNKAFTASVCISAYFNPVVFLATTAVSTTALTAFYLSPLAKDWKYTSVKGDTCQKFEEVFCLNLSSKATAYTCTISSLAQLALQCISTTAQTHPAVQAVHAAILIGSENMTKVASNSVNLWKGIFAKVCAGYNGLILGSLLATTISKAVLLHRHEDSQAKTGESRWLSVTFIEITKTTKFNRG